MKGHPIRGGIGGFLFGFFLMFDLIFLKVVKSDAAWLWILPLLFLAAGIALARVAPFGAKSEEVAVEA